MNSVPSKWREENELVLLNVYFDALIASDKVDSSIYTWEVFCIECLIAFTGCVYNPVFVGAETEMCKPGESVWAGGAE